MVDINDGMIDEIESIRKDMSLLSFNLTSTVNTNVRNLAISINGVNARSLANSYRVAYSLMSTKLEIFLSKAEHLSVGKIPTGWCQPGSIHFNALSTSLSTTDSLSLPTLKIAEILCHCDWTVQDYSASESGVYNLMSLVPISGLRQPIYRITPLPRASAGLVILSPPEESYVVSDPITGLYSKFLPYGEHSHLELDLEWTAISDDFKFDLDESDCFRGIIETGMFSECSTRVTKARSSIVVKNYHEGLWASGSGTINCVCGEKTETTKLIGHSYWKASAGCSIKIDEREVLVNSARVESREIFAFPGSFDSSESPLMLSSLSAMTVSPDSDGTIDRLRGLHRTLKNVTKEMVVTNKELSALDKIEKLSTSWSFPDVLGFFETIAWSTVLTLWCGLNSLFILLVYKKLV